MLRLIPFRWLMFSWFLRPSLAIKGEEKGLGVGQASAAGWWLARARVVREATKTSITLPQNMISYNNKRKERM